MFCRSRSNLLLGTVVVASVVSLAAFGVAGAGSPGAKMEPGKKDIVDTAIAAGSFNTLAKALTVAGLVDTLKGKGPFTVFAPTDEAFAKLPAGTLDSLLEDSDALRKVLTYHVVPGKLMAAEVTKRTSARTVQGGDLKIDTSSGVKVNNSNVVKTDIVATNGVIHVIDSVLLPN